MTYYKSKRPIDGKPPIWVIVDEDGNIVNNNPNKEELKCIDFDKTHKLKYTDEELLDYQKQFYEKYGIIPKCSDFTNNLEYPNYSIYPNRFGSWNRSLEMSGLLEKRYNSTNTCDRCGISFENITEYPLREYNKEGNWAGKWLCNGCYNKDYRKNDEIRLAEYLYEKNKECVIKKSNNHEHEKTAFPYLQNIGYNISDIKINNGNGKPDITTSDHKEWEVKVLLNNTIVFTQRQIDDFDDSVEILIYEKTENVNISERIRFADLIYYSDIYHTLKLENCPVLRTRQAI